MLVNNLAPPPTCTHIKFCLVDDGLIRSTGHFIHESSLILLPLRSHLTNLIFLDCHHRQRHAGAGGTIVALHNQFWLPSARAETCRLLVTGVTCKKVTGLHYALPMPPELPQFGYDTSTHPFSRVGIDLAGPLTMKGRSGMHIKV